MYSDDELLAEAHSRGMLDAPVAGAMSAPEFSDDELLQEAQRRGMSGQTQTLPRRQPPPPSDVFLTPPAGFPASNKLIAPPPAVPVMPPTTKMSAFFQPQGRSGPGVSDVAPLGRTAQGVDLGLAARLVSPGTPVGDTLRAMEQVQQNDEFMQRKKPLVPTNKGVGRVVQQVADTLGPWLGQQSWIDPLRRASQQQARLTPAERQSVGAVATASAAGDLFDMLANIPLGYLQDRLHVPGDKQLRSNVGDAASMLPGMEGIDAPDLFEQRRGITSLMVPIPNVPLAGVLPLLAKAQAVSPRLGRVIEQAIVGAGLVPGMQYSEAFKHGEDVNPNALAESAVMGAGGGALLGAVPEAIGAVKDTAAAAGKDFLRGLVQPKYYKDPRAQILAHGRPAPEMFAGKPVKQPQPATPAQAPQPQTNDLSQIQQETLSKYGFGSSAPKPAPAPTEAKPPVSAERPEPTIDEVVTTINNATSQTFIESLREAKTKLNRLVRGQDKVVRDAYFRRYEDAKKQKEYEIRRGQLTPQQQTQADNFQSTAGARGSDLNSTVTNQSAAPAPRPAAPNEAVLDDPVAQYQTKELTEFSEALNRPINNPKAGELPVFARDLTDAELAQEVGLSNWRIENKRSEPGERRNLSAMVSEQMRRARRKQANMPEDWAQEAPKATEVPVESMTDVAELQRIAENPSTPEDVRTRAYQRWEVLENSPTAEPAQSQQAATTAAPSATPPPRVPAEPPKVGAPEDFAESVTPRTVDGVTYGEFRFPVEKNARGRNLVGYEKGSAGVDFAELPEEVRALIPEDKLAAYAKAKADAEEAEAEMTAFAEAMLDKFGNGKDEITAGGVTVRRSADEEALGLRAQRAQENARFNLSDQLSYKAGGPYTMVTGQAGRYKPSPVVPDDMESAGKMLAQMKAEYAGRGRGKNRTEGLSDVFTRSRKDIEEHLAAAEAKLQEGDPLAHLMFKTQSTTRGGRNVTVQVDQRRPSWEMRFSEGSEAAKERYDRITKKLAEGTEKRKLSTSVTWAKALAAVIGTVMASDDAAQAAEDRFNGRGDTNWAAAGRTVLGLLALHMAAPRVARAVLKHNAFKLGWFFHDTQDKIKYLDSMLGTKVEGDIWKHMAAINDASWGVNFEDSALKQAGMDALRDGTVSVEQAMMRPADTPFAKMTPEQATALAKTHFIQQDLKQIIRAHAEKVSELAKDLETNPRLRQILEHEGYEKDLFREAREALNFVDQALSPRAAADTLARKAGEILGNITKYFFFWNPEFHGTNLSDMFIAGGGRVGPINMTRANQLLMPGIGDSELQKIFKGSNLVGGYEGERAAVNSKASIGADIPSDKINADRVALGSLLQFAQTKGKAYGWTGSDVDFAKAVLTKQDVKSDMAMDAMVHMTEVLSRTLGVDPMRLNLDVFTRSKLGPAMGLFVRQPARIARLTLNYMADGNWRGLYTMLGMTALIGGKAAIGGDASLVWQQVDPDSYFQAAKALETIDVYQNLTGNDLSPKVQWSLFYPMMSFRDPIGSSMTQAFKSTVLTLRDVADGKMDMQHGLTAIGSVAALLKPEIKNIPTRQLLNLVRAGAEAKSGKLPVYQQDPLGIAHSRKDEVPMSDLGLSPVKHVLDKFLPGESGPAARLAEAEREQIVKREGLGPRLMRSLTGKTPSAILQSFKKEDARANDPLSIMLRGGK